MKVIIQIQIECVKRSRNTVHSRITKYMKLGHPGRPDRARGTKPRRQGTVKIKSGQNKTKQMGAFSWTVCFGLQLSVVAKSKITL